MPDRSQYGSGRFGTFGGVFTPCTLTILGVIMFLRFGYVTGQSGLWNCLIIVGIAKLITTLTSLSLSAIATNTRVKGGGAYFLISRSLGVEFGGGIGIVFFLAQAISVAMYVIGFSEALAAILPAGYLSMKLIATITNVMVFICVFIGAGWTIKVQYAILAVLAASLVSFYLGAGSEFSVARLQSNLRPQFPGENFGSMFALFFPAVTGIMAGANMSGDLRNPGRAIPRGTLLSVLVTGVVYATMAVMLAGARSQEELIANNLIVSEVARWPILITAGVFAATLSSALGSMMGAPRILQALARDNIFNRIRFLGRGSGKNQEPRRAVILTFVIAQVAILLADLNTIAPLITMFFMITYCLLNLATFYEGITHNPSYRPRFRFSHWTTSLAGALGCLGVMFLIDWHWALIAIAVIGSLHTWISRQEVTARWGDMQSGLLFERTRKNLLKLEDQLYHPKNWRPIILALSGAGWDRPHLAVYGHWFTSGHGILSLGQVIQGEVDERLDRLFAQERLLHTYIRERELEAFPAVVVAGSLPEGITALIQCQGLGELRPNTVLMGWPNSLKRLENFGRTLRRISALNRNVLTVRFLEEAEDAWEAPPGTIDVWWRGHKNGELMLLLAHLLSKNANWRSRTIRLLRVVENEAGREKVIEHLTDLCESARIPAKPEFIVGPNPAEAIQTASRHAAIVLMGFETPARGDEKAFCARMEELSGPLPRVVFVHSVGGMSLES